MQQNVVFLLIALCISSSVVYGLQFTDCGSKTGSFNKVVISDCDTTKNECVLKRNTTASITINFALNEEASKITTVVHGKVLGVEMPFHLQNPDACVDSGLKCPLEKGETYEYKAILPVLKAYPKVHVLVKWELQDQNNEDIICVQIPAKIQ
ncbi:PREDICTED: protein NPC2 homolog [Rhagoletis zephyria]|uniref:protein NPC2 homolog n=2 Tax=Rhagoletis TaxID=28609 RepID=UPI000811924A|nr:PREDICTED: protein NPC2 homolog [Rhagoletis zephyria]XP_036339450.1 NPC intracellular cholesterol transporter 2 homolog a-like [Rhagoletis pomonella]